ncbi:beta/gamma crystallin-related protein [Actinomadura sp. B10D3]|uniref:beta/gamma crystallin-related protein n=1 Tax=Actinomadura sp. B10D3 TaxID=3153557 RepID=UPI00325E5F5B
MSRTMRAAAALGLGATLTLGFTASAHAAEAAAPRAAAPTCGPNRVSVYQFKNFGGEIVCPTSNYSSLGSWNDRISSVVVPANCWLTLYQHAGYKGKKSVWKRKGNYGSARRDGSLSNNNVGDNRTSSLKAGCTFDA